jgi:hypothetical protein
MQGQWTHSAQTNISNYHENNLMRRGDGDLLVKQYPLTNTQAITIISIGTIGFFHSIFSAALQNMYFAQTKRKLLVQKGRMASSENKALQF